MHGASAILTLASLGVAGLSWIALEKPLIAWGRHLTAPEGLLEGMRGSFAKLFAKPPGVS